MEIVRLGPNDWEAMKALRVRSVEEQPYAFLQTKDEALKMDEVEWRKRLSEGYFLSARSDGEILGVVAAKRDKTLKTRHVAYIFGVYVIPEARGKGMARKLMEALMEELEKDPHVIKFELNVALPQKDALKLYENLGFERVALLKKELFVNGEYIDEYAMEKFIR